MPPLCTGNYLEMANTAQELILKYLGYDSYTDLQYWANMKDIKNYYKLLDLLERHRAAVVSSLTGD